jgi:hypothetical protein
LVTISSGWTAARAPAAPNTHSAIRPREVAPQQAIQTGTSIAIHSPHSPWSANDFVEHFPAK